MFRLIAQRSVQTIVALFALLVLVFLLSRLTGDPTVFYLPLDASLEARRAFAEVHGFNDPILQQLGRFLFDVLHLDFGTSIFQGRPAMEVVFNAFPTTLQLAFWTMSLSITLSILIGSLAAWKPGSLFDRVASLLTLTGASVPDFWIAIVAILVFALTLGWLPTSGMGGPLSWIMPLAVLSLRPVGVLTQVVRSAMVEALAAAPVKTARAKGAGSGRIIFVHALRNAMLPIVSVAGDLAANIINGAFVVETVFGWPGIGNLMVDSVIKRDFAVVQASVFVSAVFIFAMNIVIDLIYSMLDPRIRTQG
jgi:peptide/nickel transport system permease protein